MHSASHTPTLASCNGSSWISVGFSTSIHYFESSLIHWDLTKLYFSTEWVWGGQSIYFHGYVSSLAPVLSIFSSACLQHVFLPSRMEPSAENFFFKFWIVGLFGTMYQKFTSEFMEMFVGIVFNICIMQSIYATMEFK